MKEIEVSKKNSLNQQQLDTRTLIKTKELITSGDSGFILMSSHKSDLSWFICLFFVFHFAVGLQRIHAHIHVANKLYHVLERS